jgi:hypothetical protein
MFFNWLKKSLSGWTKKTDVVSEIRGRGISINKFWGEENKLVGVDIIDRNRVERAYRICMEIVFKIRNGKFIEPDFEDIQLFHMIIEKIVAIRKGDISFSVLGDGEVFWLEDFMVYSDPSFKMSKEDEERMINQIRSVAYEGYLKDDIKKFLSVEEALYYFSVPYTSKETNHDNQIEEN